MYIWHTLDTAYTKIINKKIVVQPIADRVAQNFEIISETLLATQNSTRGIIYDLYRVIKWY